MTDLLRHLETRRSIRATAFTAPGPSPADLDRMLTLAVRTPDHGKLAPWRFIVFEGEARQRAGAVVAAIRHAETPDMTDEQLEIERGRFTRAPVVVAVVSTAAPHPKVPQFEQLMSAAAVTMNLIHAAFALGFKATWLTEWLAYDRRCLDAFGVKADETVVGFVLIGSAPAAEERQRPAIAGLVTRFGGE
ncbi:nitroreductase family protein [Blastochloris viridis]|uniref:Putative NAD(P)H nitroreductase n=1 Tax=Blastochloris viridis TaxID=1079 RepID=A0A0H5BJD4_BLAVI|nr:nitroreductase [Blastochloris viridis]ALK09545.1 Putative NAD(P)H nitroreductase YdjA [Blastochloris viridis]BAS00567.1 nitroreductase family protein [Blastochloris viridis]CUU42208.1 Putative NAD(P)H nitroreductase ydjA [Blastochloris viridis]